MRLVPVRPHAHLGQQGHLEGGHAGHQARDVAALKVPLLAEVGVGANWDKAH